MLLCLDRAHCSFIALFGATSVANAKIIPFRHATSTLMLSSAESLNNALPKPSQNSFCTRAARLDCVIGARCSKPATIQVISSAVLGRRF